MEINSQESRPRWPKKINLTMIYVQFGIHLLLSCVWQCPINSQYKTLVVVVAFKGISAFTISLKVQIMNIILFCNTVLQPLPAERKSNFKTYVPTIHSGNLPSQLLQHRVKVYWIICYTVDEVVFVSASGLDDTVISITVTINSDDCG